MTGAAHRSTQDFPCHLFACRASARATDASKTTPPLPSLLSTGCAGPTATASPSSRTRTKHKESVAATLTTSFGTSRLSSLIQPGATDDLRDRRRVSAAAHRDVHFRRRLQGLRASFRRRARELAPRIADVLSRVRSVISTAEPFDPATSTRRFTIGAPDGVSAVFLPPLLAELRQTAPGMDISVRQLLPLHGETPPSRAWRSAFAELEARAMDIAVVPSDDIAARFLKRKLYEEDFVAVMPSRPVWRRSDTGPVPMMQHRVVSHTRGCPWLCRQRSEATKLLAADCANQIVIAFHPHAREPMTAHDAEADVRRRDRAAGDDPRRTFAPFPECFG